MDRVIAPVHVKFISVATRQYLINSDSIVLDLVDSGLRSLVKYRLRRGKIDYERAESAMIVRHLSRSNDVIDLGAGLGFTSALAGTLLRKGREVVAVEANKRLLPSIIRNGVINGVRVIGINAAYSTSGEQSLLRVSKRDFRSSSVTLNTGTKTTVVPSISLYQIISDQNFSVFSLLVDIEGSEGDLLREELNTLKKHCIVLIIEIHPRKCPDVHTALELLEANGFSLIDADGDVRVYKNMTLPKSS